jgi:serine/threonine protein kinase
MSFSPNTTLTIRGHEYRFVTRGDKLDPNKTGDRAIVYRLIRSNDNREFALKVFLDTYQDAYNRKSFVYFQNTLPSIPAFGWVRQRMLLTEQDDAALIAQFPELRNAIVMPWFDLPQVDVVRQKLKKSSHDISVTASQNTCKHFGQLLAETLAQLEHLGIAHGDIASSNVLIDWDKHELYIIDIEDMYHASLDQPITTQDSVGGTGGYRFSDKFTSWQAAADRFAGALLISELLTLSSVACHEVSFSESYFHQDNLDTREFNLEEDNLYQVLYDEIDQINVKARDLLKSAWLTSDISKLPTLKQWSEALGTSSRPNLYIQWREQIPQAPAPQPAVVNTPIAKPTVQPPPAQQPTRPNLVGTAYERPADSDFPVLIVYLLDLSRSMFMYRGQTGGTRFSIALDMINQMNLDLLSRCLKDKTSYRPRYHIACFGYHKRTIDILTRYPNRRNGLNDSNRAPANIEDGIHPIGSLEGLTFDQHRINQITPIGGDEDLHADGETHMTQAFFHVRQLIQRNLKTYEYSHPPYVYHITDGANTDKGDVESEYTKLTALKTNYGNTLVATSYIGAPLIDTVDAKRWTGITPSTYFQGDRIQYGNSLRSITSPMPSAYHKKISRTYPMLANNAYLFFPGNDHEMIELALAASKATGK